MLFFFLPEKACKYERYNNYGVSVDQGVDRLKGPGVIGAPEYGATQLGGRLPYRLADMCERYRSVDESRIYQKWLQGGKVHLGIQDSFILHISTSTWI